MTGKKKRSDPLRTRQMTSTSPEWRQGLFDCCNQPGNAIFTCLCLPGAYGKTWERYDGSSCIANCCVMFLCQPISCICHSSKRTGLRVQYGLPESGCNDFCVTWFCKPCAVCQEAAEIDYRRGLATTGGGGGNPAYQSMA